MPLRTIARITALSPGQSPPPVSTPIRTAWNIQMRQQRLNRRSSLAQFETGIGGLGWPGRWLVFLLEEGQSVRGLKLAVSSMLIAGVAVGVAACGGGGGGTSTSASTGSKSL